MPDLEVSPQIRAVATLSALKIGKDQRIADYFVFVMQLCKDLDPNMQDNLSQMWLSKELPLTLIDIVFYSPLDALMPQH